MLRRLAALALLAVACDPAPEPRNIVLVVIDTLRADHLDLYGYRRPTAPNLASFARESVVFRRAYSHAPWTKPSLATLFTSLAPRDHGVVQWDHRLPEGLVTLAAHLSGHGYRTEAYVSHHALRPDFSRLQRGFDTYDTSAFEGRGSAHDIASAREVSDAGIAALERLEPPFFLWLHYFDPHESYLPHVDHDFGTRPVDLYDAEIAHTDDQLRRVLDVLRARGRLEDTIVVITSDHGEEFFDHGSQFHGFTLFDEVLRVPLVVRAPGLEPGEIASSVGLIDLAPTLLEMAGVPVPEAFRGESIPLEKGRFRLEGDRVIFAETRHHADAVGVVKGRWKLIEDRRRDRTLLFDLERDPAERVDLSASRPRVARMLAQELRGYTAGVAREPDTEALDAEQQQVLEALGYGEAEPSP